MGFIKDIAFSLDAILSTSCVDIYSNDEKCH